LNDEGSLDTMYSNYHLRVTSLDRMECPDNIPAFDAGIRHAQEHAVEGDLDRAPRGNLCALGDLERHIACLGEPRRVRRDKLRAIS